jgi:hypothetical protein
MSLNSEIANPQRYELQTCAYMPGQIGRIDRSLLANYKSQVSHATFEN